MLELTSSFIVRRAGCIVTAPPPVGNLALLPIDFSMAFIKVDLPTDCAPTTMMRGTWMPASVDNDARRS